MRTPAITNDHGRALLVLRDCGEAITVGELAARMWPGEAPRDVRVKTSLRAFRRVRQVALDRAWRIVEELADGGLVTHHGRDSILITETGVVLVASWGHP